MPIPFTKPWLNYSDQLAVLQQRGVVVTDPAAAEQFLSHVNYYRLSGYCLAFEDGTRHAYVPGTTFESIRYAYEFDFALRDLLSEALEVIEVDVRTAVAHHFGLKYGAFGHTDAANFHRPKARKKPAPAGRAFDHADWLKQLHHETRRSKELFVTHFKATYDCFPNLPIWVATEVMSFGALSKMFEGMTFADQRAVASRYRAQPRVLASWAHHLSVVRNHCAHHGRLWDRPWSVRPMLPVGKAWRPPHLLSNERLAVTLLILRHLLRRCPTADEFSTAWRDRVSRLLANPPAAPDALTKMGMTPDWANGPLWQ